MTTISREKIVKYFTPISGRAISMLIISLIAIVVGVGIAAEDDEVGTAIIAVSGLIFFICLVVLIAQASGRPSDDEIDTLLGKDLKDFPNIALKNLGLDESQVVGEYIYVWTPPLNYLMLAIQKDLVPFQSRRGKDGRYRW